MPAYSGLPLFGNGPDRTRRSCRDSRSSFWATSASSVVRFHTIQILNATRIEPSITVPWEAIIN